MKVYVVMCELDEPRKVFCKKSAAEMYAKVHGGYFFEMETEIDFVDDGMRKWWVEFNQDGTVKKVQQDSIYRDPDIFCNCAGQRVLIVEAKSEGAAKTVAKIIAAKKSTREKWKKDAAKERLSK